MKNLLFSLAIAAMLAIIAGATCVLLNLLYVNWLHLPIESVAVVVFFFETAPCVFILGIFYSLGVRRILNRKGAAAGVSPGLIAFTIGALGTILILDFLFPCDALPYFDGGYC